MPSNITGRYKKRILDISYISLFCAIITVSSWISVPLGVSVTLQTFAVCACAGILGAARGLLSVALYICLGAIGLPVFTGFRGGLAALAGSTGGYIIGFLFVALIVGLAADIFGRKAPVMAISMTLGVIVCYIFGSLWFWILYTNNTGNIALSQVLLWCVAPFIIPDAIKIALAVFVVGRIGKRTVYKGI